MPKKYLPKYDYTGESHVESDDDYWYIYLKSTGVLSLEWPKTIDVFLVGGGGSGGNGTGAGGGGGGYTANGRQISIAAHQDYRIVVGLGGVGGESLPEAFTMRQRGTAQAVMADPVAAQVRTTKKIPAVTAAATAVPAKSPSMRWVA